MGIGYRVNIMSNGISTLRLLGAMIDEVARGIWVYAMTLGREHERDFTGRRSGPCSGLRVAISKSIESRNIIRTTSPSLPSWNHEPILAPILSDESDIRTVGSWLYSSIVSLSDSEDRLPECSADASNFLRREAFIVCMKRAMLDLEGRIHKE